MAFFYENGSYEDNRADTSVGESDERERATRASNRSRYLLAGVMLVTVVLVLFICLSLLIVEKETTVQGQDRGDGRPSQAIEKGKVYLMSNIDECSLSSLCGINATCVNTKGSYVCRCGPGYAGDGLNCTDLNECEAPSNDCDPNASCNNTIGSHTCNCNKAYYGDGKSCVKKRQYGLESSLILKHYGNTIYYLDTLYRYLKPVIRHAATNRWVRCWRARTDGWAASTFHKKCDGKGPTVTIIRVGTYVFGGYTDVSWHSRGEYSSSSRSFLYTLHNGKGYYPIKLTLTGRYNQYAIYWNSGYGPIFGYGHDILIYNDAANNKISCTNPQSYQPPPGCSYDDRKCSFLAGSYSFTPSDVEVFYETIT